MQQRGAEQAHLRAGVLCRRRRRPREELGRRRGGLVRGPVGGAAEQALVAIPNLRGGGLPGAQARLSTLARLAARRPPRPRASWRRHGWVGSAALPLLLRRHVCRAALRRAQAPRSSRLRPHMHQLATSAARMGRTSFQSTSPAKASSICDPAPKMGEPAGLTCRGPCADRGAAGRSAGAAAGAWMGRARPALRRLIALRGAQRGGHGEAGRWTAAPPRPAQGCRRHAASAHLRQQPLRIEVHQTRIHLKCEIVWGSGGRAGGGGRGHACERSGAEQSPTAGPEAPGGTASQAAAQAAPQGTPLKPGAAHRGRRRSRRA